jgi:hypothetical protein
MLRLGVRVSATAIRTTLQRHGLDPAPRPTATTDGPNAIRDAQRGEVCRHDRLGGLLHEYRRAA